VLSQVRFNRVPEKVPGNLGGKGSRNVSEKVIEMFGIKSSKIQ